MEVNKDLNLVVPIDRGDVTVYAYSVPISRQVFESYHSVLAKAFSELTEGGISVVASLATARLALRDAAIAKGAWEGKGGVQDGLMREIRRLTQVYVPTDDGWDTMLLDDAAKRSLMDEDEILEVENAIVFFTLISRMFKKSMRQIVVNGMASMAGLPTTSLPFMEWHASLQTLKEDETSPPKEE